MRCFTHEAMQDATLEPWMAHWPSVAKPVCTMLSMGNVLIACGQRPDWVQIVDQMLSDECQRIAALEKELGVETSRHICASIDERVDMLKRKLKKKRARLLAKMYKMDHVMSRFDTAYALLVKPRYPVS